MITQKFDIAYGYDSQSPLVIHTNFHYYTENDYIQGMYSIEIQTVSKKLKLLCEQN